MTEKQRDQKEQMFYEVKQFLNANKEFIIRYYLQDPKFIKRVNEIYRKEFKTKTK